MARTLHVQLTPSRKSKRLVENGYYSIPPSDGNQVNSSEDDDNTSIHSNSSSLYSERSVKYRESPPIGSRRRRFKRTLVDSPHKLVSVNLAASAHRKSKLAKRKQSKDILTTSASALLPGGELAVKSPSPPYSQSTTQLESRSEVYRMETTVNSSSPILASRNRLSAGDYSQTNQREEILQTHSNLQTETSTDLRRKTRNHSSDDVQNYNLQSFITDSVHRLLSLVRTIIYSLSKAIYLIALTAYSWEVLALAWRIGAAPIKWFKFCFLVLLLLATSHFVARHSIGEEYASVTWAVVSRGWAGEKQTVTIVPTAVKSEEDGAFQSQYFDAALTKVEVAFAFKLAEMKESIRSLHEEFERTHQQILKVDKSNSEAATQINLLQDQLDKQQESSVSMKRDLQNMFRDASQDFVSKKEWSERMIVIDAQQSRLDDLIMMAMQKYDKQIRNESRVREIAAVHFVESFLTILQNTKASDDDLGRVQTAFLSWLNDRGYVTREKVDSDIKLLQGLYATKLERIRQDVRRHSSTITLEKIVERPLVEPQQAVSSGMEAEVKKWIQEALALYSADRVALADFALESAGGFVVSTRCSESYDKKTALVSILGIPFYYNINTPRSVIQPGNLPGECWSFKGREGYIVIALSGSVRPSSFSLEHIPRELSLMGHIDSAPKDFVVLGLADADDKGTVLGNYRYEEDGPVIQQFVKEDSNQEFFTHVELRVRSNWGNPTYTCLYRFRVHGERGAPQNPTS